MNLQKTHQSLIENVDELRGYIDQHVLWIRSAEPLSAGDLRESLQAIKAIGVSHQWQSLVNGVTNRLTLSWPVLAMVLIGLWLAIGMRSQLDRRLRAVARRRNLLRVSPIVRTLVMTLLQASFFPALVAVLGWLLATPYETGTLRDAFSRGLLLIAPQLFVACFAYRLSIRQGMAESQLGWSRNACDQMRKATGTIARYCLPLVALTAVAERLDGGRWMDSLGRLSLMAAMFVLSLATFRLLHGVAKTWKNDPVTYSIWSIVA